MKRTVISLAGIFLVVGVLPAQELRDKYRGGALYDALKEARQRSTNTYDGKFISFVEASRQRAQDITKRAKTKFDPRLTQFFDAMAKLQFAKAEEIYAYSKDIEPPEVAAIMNECAGFYPIYGDIPQKDLEKFTREFGDSIPRGSIYFGGTDPGRYLSTWYVQNLNTDAGYFTVSQNQLVDQSYLKYLRAWHGDAINLPSKQELQEAFQSFSEDARKRYDHDRKFPHEPKQIRPGEIVTRDPASGRLSISGQVAVMAVNELLLRQIISLNPEREFYLEESFPLTWTYPRLRPHGPIFKLERQPIHELTEAEVKRDREYWRQAIGELIGDWIDDGTSVSEIARFVRSVHHDRNFDGFTGNRQFIESSAWQKGHSKLRTAIAGLYSWRINHAASQGNRTSQQRMTKEADLAFRQAWALCPVNPEVVFRYVQLLVSQQRNRDAITLAETFLQFAPDNQAVKALLQQLQTQHAR